MHDIRDFFRFGISFFISLQMQYVFKYCIINVKTLIRFKKKTNYNNLTFNIPKITSLKLLEFKMKSERGHIVF